MSVNPEFVFQFDDKGVGYIIVHENLHKAGRHMTTYIKLVEIYGHRLVNMACDYWINNKINKADPDKKLVAMPHLNGKPVGLYDPKYDGWTVLQIIKDLKEQEQEQEQDQDGEGEGGEGFDEHDWEGEESLSDAERKEIASKIDEALRQGAILAGKKGGQMDRALSGLLEPKINWREALREFVTTQCSGRDMSTWRKVNRRFVSSGMYLPGHISESVGRVLVGVDTSGSVGAEELRDFLREQVARYKVPRIIEFRSELPKSSMMKLLRRELRDEELRAMQDEV